MASISSVQRGQINLASGSASVNVTQGVSPGFIAAIDTTKTIFEFSLSDVQSDGAFPRVRGIVSSSALLTFDTIGVNGGTKTIEWQLASFESGVYVQHIAITLPVGVATGSASVVAPSLGGVRWIMPLGLYTSQAVTLRAAGTKNVIMNDTTVHAMRTNTTVEVTIPLQIVEYVGATIQTSSLSFDTGQNTSASLSHSISTAVDITKTAIYSSEFCNYGSADSNFVWMPRLIDSGTIGLQRYYTGSEARSTLFTLVSFTDGTTVQPVLGYLSGSVISGSGSITAVAVSQSLITTPMASVGTQAYGLRLLNEVGSAIPGRVLARHTLTSPTTVMFTRTSTTFDMNFYGDVIQFVTAAPPAARSPIIIGSALPRTMIVGIIGGKPAIIQS